MQNDSRIPLLNAVNALTAAPDGRRSPLAGRPSVTRR